MLSIKDLHKHYRSKKGEDYHALKGLNIDFPTKGFVFIIGKSGSGKSTLMNVLGGLDRYDSGEIFIKGKSSKTFKSQDWDSYRNTYLGFVFQDFNIIDSYTIGANIALALQLQGVKASEAKSRTIEILQSVEASELIDRKPNELSGGQKQRIAIARALVKNPEIIIADEPTGNLDSETSAVIMKILKRLAEERLVIMVTHDLDYANDYGDRVIEMRDGNIIKDESRSVKTQETLQTFKSERNQDETAIKLPKGASLTQETVDAINQLIRKNPSQNIYLTASVDPSVAAIINQNVLTTQQNKETSSEVALDYTVKGAFHLIKSKLPFHNSFSMALNSIWTKKFKLIFVVILFIAAIGLFGFSRTVTRFDFPMASSLSYLESGTDQVSLSKQIEVLQPWGETENVNSIFLKSETNELKAQTNLPFGYTYEFAAPISLGNNQDNTLVKAKQIKGLLEIETLRSMNLDLAIGRFPLANDEVMITDYVAEQLKTTTLEAYLNSNPTLKLPFKTVKVVGIIATDYQDYLYLNGLNETQLRGEQASVLAFNNSNNILFSRVVVASGFYEAYEKAIDVMMNYYSLTVYIESRDNDNDFPYDFIGEAFLDPSHEIIGTDYIAYFNGYTNVPENGILIDTNTYARLLLSLGRINDMSALEYLYNWGPLEPKVARLEAAGFGALTVTTSFNNRVNQSWDENTESIIVGIVDFERYRQEVLFPRLGVETLEDNNIDFIAQATFERYTSRGYYDYLEALARIHFPSALSYEAYMAENAVEDWQYYQYLRDGLYAVNLAFIGNEQLFGYSLYLRDLMVGANLPDLTFTQYLQNNDFDEFAYIGALRSALDGQNISYFNENTFFDTYLSFGPFYTEYLRRQIQENNLSYDSVYSDLYSVAILSPSVYDRINPYTSEKVHGLVVQLSNNLDEVYTFFTVAENLGVAHATPSGELLQIFADFTSEADSIFGYVSLGVAGFAGLLLFLNISASILAKKKEIGTLRAMGARGNDVASIFVNEALLLGLISAVLAIVGIIIATLELNGFLSNQLGQTLSIFNISPVIMGEMLILTLGIVLLASFLPVKRVSSMKPIDAIKNK